MANTALDADTKIFLKSVVNYTNATYGKAGLLRLQTDQGMIDLAAEYVESNRKTVNTYLSAPSDVQEKITSTICKSVYDRINNNAKPENTGDPLED